jgi:hypothetical protein
MSSLHGVSAPIHSIFSRNSRFKWRFWGQNEFLLTQRRLAEAPRRLHVRASDQGYLPIRVEDYVMLPDWTGRELRADERGAIPAHLARIVERLGNDVVDLEGQNVERLREPAVFAGVFGAVSNHTFQCLVHRVRRQGKRARSMRSEPWRERG